MSNECARSLPARRQAPSGHRRQPRIRACDRARGGGGGRRRHPRRARSRSALGKTADEVRERGRQAWTIAADIARAERMRGPVQAGARRAWPPSTFSSTMSAGAIVDVAIENAELDDWRRFVDLNLTHCFICTKMIGGAMLARGQGRVINIASISGLIANRGIGGRHYETSKAAVIHFTRADRRRLGAARRHRERDLSGPLHDRAEPGLGQEESEGDRNLRQRDSDGPRRRPGRDRTARGLSRFARFQLRHRRRLRRSMAAIRFGDRSSARHAGGIDWGCWK